MSAPTCVMADGPVGDSDLWPPTPDHTGREGKGWGEQGPLRSRTCGHEEGGALLYARGQLQVQSLPEGQWGCDVSPENTAHVDHSLGGDVDHPTMYCSCHASLLALPATKTSHTGLGRSSIHPFQSYLLNNRCVPGPGLDAGVPVDNNTGKAARL